MPSSLEGLDYLSVVGSLRRILLHVTLASVGAVMCAFTKTLEHRHSCLSMYSRPNLLTGVCEQQFSRVSAV